MPFDQVQHLSRADLVVVLRGGRITATGSYDDLLAAGHDFGELTHADEQARRVSCTWLTAILNYALSSGLKTLVHSTDSTLCKRRGHHQVSYFAWTTHFPMAAQETDSGTEPLAEEALRDAAHDGLLPAATMSALPDDVLDSAASAALERSDRVLPAAEAPPDLIDVSDLSPSCRQRLERHSCACLSRDTLKLYHPKRNSRIRGVHAAAACTTGSSTGGEPG